ncbi:ABC transporter ATP-binding protein [Desulfuromonas thiophila]|uniref:Putative ABC transport system ATP-binding protein n=1 Tax=Desulfuromonas thiophila TaxID=57664 RepID=A0A1G7A3Y3_9BACT|nr:ABC transporter ATP-binding protein [Desulfuromonas thiophila]SDE09628.1 putative ABC transport system ATP-binding protein [Desulfuromonas thiophila]
MTALLQLRHACRSYRTHAGAVAALVDIDLTIAAGQSWAVMGASGSGKSTLLNILGALDRLDSGSYELDGVPLTRLDDDALSDLRLRRFGFIFQSFHLIAQLDVLENIALPLFYRQTAPDLARQRAHQLADQVGLADRLHHRPAQLSGGQQQRVAIARALANDPAVILADEPTGNLDSATGEQIMDLLLALPPQGKALIMVTHNDALARHCSHRLWLKDGRVARLES